MRSALDAARFPALRLARNDAQQTHQRARLPDPAKHHWSCRLGSWHSDHLELRRVDIVSSEAHGFEDGRDDGAGLVF
jgi:hypothetical protein